MVSLRSTTGYSPARLRRARPHPPLYRISTTSKTAWLTARAVIAGVVFGLIFGAANAYLGLRVGLTVSTSIPIAVLTVALFRLMQRREGGVILEANLSQTIGSASSSLATGKMRVEDDDSGSSYHLYRWSRVDDASDAWRFENI